jgi:hypothetical protein
MFSFSFGWFPTTQLRSRLRRWYNVCTEVELVALDMGARLPGDRIGNVQTVPRSGSTTQSRPVPGPQYPIYLCISNCSQKGDRVTGEGAGHAHYKFVRRKVDMYRDGRARAPIGSEQDEAAADVRRDGDDGEHADLFVRELVLAPVEAFVSREQHVVRRFLIVCHDQDRAGVAKLPQVRILVYLLPREPCVAAQERVALRVWRKLIAHVSHRHDQPNDGRAAERRAGVEPLCVSVHVERASLPWASASSDRNQTAGTNAPRSDNRTLDRESRLWGG